MVTDVLLPRFYTAPLSEDFPSDGPKLRRLFSLVWRDPQTGKRMVLEPWQEWLIDRLLEKYPEGHPRAGELRFRQVVILLPRQSGKSLIAACLSLYLLFLHARTPIVVGVAGRSAEQAGIVFRRLKQAITDSPPLKREFRRVTSTRGLELRNGGTYLLYPSRGASVQGIDITGALLDELHLARPDLWEALLYGQRAQDKSLIVAISTAGDEDSTLLNDLTVMGRQLSDSYDEHSRMGYWEWSCPPEIPYDSPEAVLSCHPRVANGTIPLDRVMAEIKLSRPDEVKRYTLNITTRAAHGWMDVLDWAACQRKWPELPANVKPTVAACEITPGATYGSITLAGTDENGHVHTALYCSIPNPSTSRMAELLQNLAGEFPGITLAVDSLSGKELAERLGGMGLTVRRLSLADVANATAWVYDAIKRRAVTHDGHALLNRQIRSVQGKVLPRGGYRVVPKKGTEMDTVASFISAAYTAHKLIDEPEENIGLYVI